MAKMKFKVGDRVFDPKYGFGVVRQFDPYNYEFPYDIDYEDGTKILYAAEGAVFAKDAKALKEKLARKAERKAKQNKE